MLGEHWFKGYPGVALTTNKIGLVPRTRRTRSGCCATSSGSRSCSPRARRAPKLYWQRYRLRRLGRGGFVRTAIRAGVPIVPIAVIGAEEAMPIFAHVPLLQRLTGLIYFPVNHAFPHFGCRRRPHVPAAKFKIRFLEPDRPVGYRPRTRTTCRRPSVAEEIRARSAGGSRRTFSWRVRASVWFG